MKRVFVPGVFDVFHVGHLNYLKQAAQMGDYVIVGVQDDRAVLACRGKRPTVPLADRVAVLESLRFVDEVVSYVSVFQRPLLEDLDINVLAIGEEYGNDDRLPDQRRTLEFCNEHGIEVVRISGSLYECSGSIRQHLKEFWNSRAERASDLTGGVTVLGSFKGDQAKVSEETRVEVDLVLQASEPCAEKSLLDLGTGDGRQLMYLCTRFRRAVGVDYAPGLLEIARRRIEEAGGDAELVEYDVAEFTSPEQFDVLLLSGILPCLDDKQCAQLLANVSSMARPDATVLVRTSVGLGQRIDVINQYSAELKSRYTAFYRTVPEILDAFESIGMACLKRRELYRHREDSAVWWFEFQPVSLASHDASVVLTSASSAPTRSAHT